MYSEEELERRKKLNEQGYWEIPEGLDISNFDFNWRPYIYERPYIHQFGTQWQKTGGPKFIVPQHEGIKYQNLQHAIRLPDSNNRSWRPLIANATIDYSWHPDDTDPPFIYVFGNQWHDSETMPTYQYRVKGATDKKYVYNVKATLLSNKDKWQIPDNIDDSNFDYSWCPNPYEPPLNWQFGTQWQKTGGPTYINENAHGVKYVDFQKVKKLPNSNDRCWRPLVNNSTIDFSWHPDETEPPYIYVFGNQWYDSKTMPTYQYKVKGATEKKYVHDLLATLLPDVDSRCWRPLVNNAVIDQSWVPNPHDPPYIYVFGNQWYDGETMPTYQYRVKDATDKKYIKDLKAVLLPNKENWKIPDDIDDRMFDYSWVPNPHDPLMNYEFGTQWQKTGGPIYAESSVDIKKYCSDQRVIKLPNIRNFRVVEPINIDSFDFSWHPDDTEEKYNYVFGNQYHSSENMPTVIYKSKNAQSNKFINEIKCDLKINEVEYIDSIFDRINEYKEETTYTYIGNINLNFSNIISDDPIPHVHIVDDVAALIPKNAKVKMYDKLEDYPYVKYHNLGYRHEPLDIIFLSNGEQGENDRYEHLLEVTKHLPNRVIKVSNVKGRVASQHAAANAALTPWYFLINSKCKVSPNFDFSYQPKRTHTSKHYIFTATNILNGLEYGHMAVVLNNKNLTLSTTGKGLDFTLDSPHTLVNINSGIGIYNTSEWDTWRTAFREVIKLKYNSLNLIDEQSRYRLDVWLSVADGQFSQWSLKGAKDAVDYYETVDGEFDKLKLSYDWEWLYNHYTTANNLQS
jgi:hypothetical protein